MNSSPNLAPAHELPTDASASCCPSLVDIDGGDRRAAGEKADEEPAAARNRIERIILLKKNLGVGGSMESLGRPLENGYTDDDRDR